MKRTITIWQVYLLSTIGFSLLAYISLCIATSAVDPLIKSNPYWKEWSSFILGTLISSLYTISILALRISQKFWKLAREIENEVDNAKSRSCLLLIQQTDIPILMKMAGSSLQFAEVNKISTIINIKLKYVK